MEIRRRPPNPSIKVANLEYAIPHPDSKPKNILEEIVWEKHYEVEIARKKVSLEDLKKKIMGLPKTRQERAGEREVDSGRESDIAS